MVFFDNFREVYIPEISDKIDVEKFIVVGLGNDIFEFQNIIMGERIENANFSQHSFRVSNVYNLIKFLDCHFLFFLGVEVLSNDSI